VSSLSSFFSGQFAILSAHFLITLVAEISLVNFVSNRFTKVFCAMQIAASCRAQNAIFFAIRKGPLGICIVINQELIFASIVYFAAVT